MVNNYGMDSHLCLLRVRNHPQNDLAKSLANDLAHKLRHENREDLTAYATDHKSVRLYGTRAKSGKSILILQKNFETYANVIMSDVNSFNEEFIKAATCYNLDVMWGGKCFDGTNPTSAVKGIANALIY